MIQSECVKCGELIFISIDERYLEELENGKALFEKYVCPCGQVNFVEHRRIDGRTLSEEDFMKNNPTKIFQ